MRSRVEPTGSMHHAIASVPGGEDHVLKSGSRTRLRRSYRWHPSMSRRRGVIIDGSMSDAMGSLSIGSRIDSLSSRVVAREDLSRGESMPSVDSSMEPSMEPSKLEEKSSEVGDAIASRGVTVSRGAIASIIDSRCSSDREREGEREEEREKKGRTHGMGSARVGFPAEGGGLRRQSSGWVGRCRRRLG
jgi:hypothetical protein